MSPPARMGRYEELFPPMRLHHRREYLPSDLQKKAAPATPPVEYSFATEVDGDLADTGASVLLDKK